MAKLYSTSLNCLLQLAKNTLLLTCSQLGKVLAEPSWGSLTECFHVSSVVLSLLEILLWNAILCDC